MRFQETGERYEKTAAFHEESPDNLNVIPKLKQIYIQFLRP